MSPSMCDCMPQQKQVKNTENSRFISEIELVAAAAAAAAVVGD